MTIYDRRCPSTDPYDGSLRCVREIHDDDKCYFGGIAWKKNQPRYVQIQTTEPELQFAIERIKNSMATHQAWIEHFETHDCQDWAEHTVGDAEHHRKVLAEYQRVLDILEK